MDRRPPGAVVTPGDAEKALAAAGLAVRPGDAVLFHTGHGALWYADPAGYAAGEPGPGTALAEWLVAHRVALTGCDTWSYGPHPAEDPDAPFVVPQTLNTRHGVVVVENLRLAEHRWPSALAVAVAVLLQLLLPAPMVPQGRYLLPMLELALLVALVVAHPFRSTSPGPSFHTGGPYGYTTKGGTGVPVRTLAAVPADIVENG